MNNKEYRSKLTEFMEKKEQLKPVAKDFARQLVKKDLTIEEAGIVATLLHEMVKPDVQDKKLSDFI
ncbi:hypothetical protein LNP00_02950 [Fructobacillus sp. M158]|uniref:hypothetical protein n=1 Tax=Fructobacillus parabroussonetiae TaxID=2713174 RepID=UPI00200AD70D|nr:hypothetical protein [Fructobacillus parabroussonetiae]MCK8617329.1 hypothetical protein [Fructobacillus parabroussonetiae]